MVGQDTTAEFHLSVMRLWCGFPSTHIIPQSPASVKCISAAPIWPCVFIISEGRLDR